MDKKQREEIERIINSMNILERLELNFAIFLKAIFVEISSPVPKSLGLIKFLPFLYKELETLREKIKDEFKIHRCERDFFKTPQNTKSIKIGRN